MLKPALDIKCHLAFRVRLSPAVSINECAGMALHCTLALQGVALDALNIGNRYTVSFQLPPLIHREAWETIKQLFGCSCMSHRYQNVVKARERIARRTAAARTAAANARDRCNWWHNGLSFNFIVFARIALTRL